MVFRTLMDCVQKVFMCFKSVTNMCLRAEHFFCSVGSNIRFVKFWYYSISDTLFMYKYGNQLQLVMKSMLSSPDTLSILNDKML